MVVIMDASVAIAWQLRDRPGTPYADAAVDRGGTEGMVVPDLFWHEVRSALIVAERTERIAVGMMSGHMEDIRALDIETDVDHADEAVSALAQTRLERLRRGVFGDRDSAWGDASDVGQGSGTRSG